MLKKITCFATARKGFDVGVKRAKIPCELVTNIPLTVLNCMWNTLFVMLYHQLPHFVSLLTCSHSTGQKIPYFYRTIRLIIKFTKACLWILHPGPAKSIPQCTPVSTTKCFPSGLIRKTFSMHMLNLSSRPCVLHAQSLASSIQLPR